MERIYVCNLVEGIVPPPLWHLGKSWSGKARRSTRVHADNPMRRGPKTTIAACVLHQRYLLVVNGVPCSHRWRRKE